jgi:hypothetical protein
MIISFKIFENNKEPQIGDYVVCNIIDNFDADFQNFIKYNIGKIIDYVGVYYCEYENIPEKIDKFFDGTNFITALSNEIIFYSENKKDVETYLKAKKYNI